MADNTVNVSLVVSVVSKGQEQLTEIDKKLEKLSGSHTKAVAVSKKATTETTALTQALGKQVPILRDIMPLFQTTGFAIAAAATAAMAIGAGVSQASQAFQTWMFNLLGFAVNMNLLTGTQTNYNNTLVATQANADKVGLSLSKFTAYINTLDQATKKPITSLGILNDAVSISRTTGLPLDDVVNSLGDAFAHGLYFDGKQISPGIIALQTLENSMIALGPTAQGSRNEVNDAWDKMVEFIKTGIGGAAASVESGFKKIALDVFTESDKAHGWVGAVFGPLGSILDMFTNFSQSIGTWGIWDNIGKTWSSAWTGAWSYIKGDWDRMTAYLGNFDWGSLWKNLGSTWSAVWRGAINFAIIDPINNMIRLLDMIHVTLPSWLFGGGTIGFNISPIPELANGGNLLSGGDVIVGERGAERLSLPAGASVSPLNNSGPGLGGPITIPIYIGNELLTTYVIKGLDDIVRLRGAF
jgi:hypothetical protein